MTYTQRHPCVSSGHPPTLSGMSVILLVVGSAAASPRAGGPTGVAAGGTALAALPVWPPDPCGRISDVRSRNSWWRCPETGVARVAPAVRGISSNPVLRPHPPGPRWIIDTRSGGSADAWADDTDTAATVQLSPPAAG